MSLREWLRRRREGRQARDLLRAAFRAGEALRGTSLKPHHAARSVIVRRESEGGKVARIWFGILRHPRPYPFSRQSHKVLEYYLYEAATGRIERLEGHNLTRAAGEDAGE